MKSLLNLLVPTLILLLACSDRALANSQMFGQSSFTYWGGTGYGSAAMSSSSTGPRTTGGNPGSYVRVQTSASAPTGTNPVWVYDFNILSAWSFNPSVEGPITGIDYSQDAKLFGGPPGVPEMGIALRQDGYAYFAIGQFYVTNTQWTTQSVMNLSANDFFAFSTNVNGYAPMYHPDFSSTGHEIQFGVYQRLFTPAGGPAVSTDYGMDNISITINYVPEPGVAALGVIGFVGLFTFMRPRMRVASDSARYPSPSRWASS